MTFFTEFRETLLPSKEEKDGPLPPLLVALTLVTGLVDSFSYLVLGHVFVANMTGNVLFIAFALAGAQGFSIALSLVALGGFLVGSLAGGLLGSRVGSNRGRLLSLATMAQASLLGVAVFFSILAGDVMPVTFASVLIIALAVSMGLQNATARNLAVPDLTTTVLTLTITGMVADSTLAGGRGSKAGRRLVSVLAMFTGALIGVLAILDVSVYPVLLAFGATALVSIASRILSAGGPPWTRKEPIVGKT